MNARIVEEAGFAAAILGPLTTGLRFAISVHQRDGSRQGPWIAVAERPAGQIRSAVAVTLEHPPRALEHLPAADLAAVVAWIELNRTTLEAYWSGEIEYTEDMLAEIKKV